MYSSSSKNLDSSRLSFIFSVELSSSTIPRRLYETRPEASEERSNGVTDVKLWLYYRVSCEIETGVVSLLAYKLWVGRVLGFSPAKDEPILVEEFS